MLYVVMLGGRHPRAKIEVHDVVFAVAESLEGTYSQLREGWFGSPAGMHIDSWMAVDGVEGYKLAFTDQAPAGGAVTITTGLATDVVDCRGVYEVVLECTTGEGGSAQFEDVVANFDAGLPTPSDVHSDSTA